MPIPADSIDPDARKVIRRLVRHSYQAYLVGGCVRDLLLSRTPKDFDIATSATPNEVKALFRNCRIIGRRFRLAHIFFGPKLIETATFRANPREVELGTGDDGEDPLERDENDLLIRRDNVFGTAEEDARRRDFTINGLFYDIENDEVIDYVGGLGDLAARTVRTIGDPDIRFREDPVRILRAIKFAARLDFDIEENAWRAIRDHQREIVKCAAPRILEEIYRLLRGGAARRSIELLRDTGVLELLLPEIAEILRERPDGAEVGWFFSMLDRLDTERERTPSNATLLCMLLAPFVGEAVYEDPASASGRTRDLGAYLEERTRPMLERMKVARRDIERARQILLTQRRLMPAKRRRPTKAAAHLLRRDWFEEALHVFELVGLTVKPTDGADEELTYWRRLLHGEPRGESRAEADSGPSAPGEAQGAADGSETGAAAGGRRRRRRRRGGRRGAGEQAMSSGGAIDLAAAGDAGFMDDEDGSGDEGSGDEESFGAGETASADSFDAEALVGSGDTFAADEVGGERVGFSELSAHASVEVIPVEVAAVEVSLDGGRKRASREEELADAAAPLAEGGHTSAAPPSTGSTTPER